MKAIKLLSLLICFTFILFITSCVEEDHIMENYPSLTDEKHIIKELTPKELLTKVENKETFIVLLGFPACPWCQAIMPEYNEVAKTLNIEEIYYVDIKDMRDNPESVDHNIYLTLYEKFIEAADQEKERINAPTIMNIKEGNLAAFHIDTVSSHIINEAGILPPLEEEQKKDSRIHFFVNSKNMGAAMSRNRALFMCKGKYVAIMDADDVCDISRLEDQIS